MNARRPRAPIREKQAYRVSEFCEDHGIGRTKAYEEMDTGRLRYVKLGRIRLIPADGAREWLRALSANS